MNVIQHFAAGQKDLAQAATATQPERLIGLAQGHFAAAQILLEVMKIHESPGWNMEAMSEWTAAIDQQFDPNGRPVKA